MHAFPGGAYGVALQCRSPVFLEGHARLSRYQGKFGGPVAFGQSATRFFSSTSDQLCSFLVFYRVHTEYVFARGFVFGSMIFSRNSVAHPRSYIRHIDVGHCAGYCCGFESDLVPTRVVSHQSAVGNGVWGRYEWTPEREKRRARALYFFNRKRKLLLCRLVISRPVIIPHPWANICSPQANHPSWTGNGSPTYAHPVSNASFVRNVKTKARAFAILLGWCLSFSNVR